MQIALCDDEERQLDLLGGFLRAYEAEHGMDLTLTRFFSGEALLAAPREFSIVFMDIYLDGLLGTETIRRLGGEAQVVFITTSREHAIEAFGLGARPLSAETHRTGCGVGGHGPLSLPPGRQRRAVLQIQTSHGSIPVSAAQITYIEVFDKLCIVHTAKQQFQTYTALNTSLSSWTATDFSGPSAALW